MSERVTRQQRRAQEREHAKLSGHGPNTSDGSNRTDRRSFRRLITEHSDRQHRILAMATPGIGGAAPRKRNRR